MDPSTADVSNALPATGDQPSNAVCTSAAATTTTDIAQAIASILNGAAVDPRATKAPPAGSKNNQTGNSSATTDQSAPATAAIPAQAAANLPQPVAAAVIVNNGADVAPAATSTAASAPAIGVLPGPRAKVAKPVGGDQGAVTTQTQPAQTLPPQTKDGAPVRQPASASQADGVNAVNSGSSDSAPPQAQAPTDETAAISVAPPDSGHALARPDALSTPSPAETGARAAAQAANGVQSDGLPNFGLSAANMATPLAAAATPGSPAAAVPVAGLAVAIAARAKAGSNQFDIRLDPPELGRIDVRLDVDRSGQVTSHITVDRADTLQLLQSQQPQLERALEQAGLKTADNGLQFTLRDQSFAGQNGSGSSGQPGAARLVVPDAELAPVETAAVYSRLSLGSGIDIRV